MQMANHAVADQSRFISRFHLSVHRSVRKIKRNKKERERERWGGKKMALEEVRLHSNGP